MNLAKKIVVKAASLVLAFAFVFSLAVNLPNIRASADSLIPDGIYKVVSKIGNKHLNVYAGWDKDGTNVCIWEEDGSREQLFRISYLGGNKYKFYPMSSNSGNGRVLDVYRPLANGANVDIWADNDPKAQQFELKKQYDGYYTIALSANPETVITVKNGQNSNNVNVLMQNYAGNASQHWKFVNVSTPAPPPTPAPDPDPDPTPTPNPGPPVNDPNPSANININSTYYKGSNPFYGSYTGQCTWFAWGRAYEATGKKLPSVRMPGGTTGPYGTYSVTSFYGGARKWWNDNQYLQSIGQGYLASRTPRANSIMVWNGWGSNAWGHLAFAEGVNGGSVYVSQANLNGNNGGRLSYDAPRWYTASSIETMYQKSFLGYIHLDMPVSTYRSRLANLPKSSAVTLSDKQEIAQLAGVYNSLYSFSKDAVGDISRLDEASDALYEIESLIADIGALKNPYSRSTTSSTYEDVQALQKRYEALSDVQKADIGNYSKLEELASLFEAQQSEE